jgi:hypothetical protein
VCEAGPAHSQLSARLLREDDALWLR